MKLTSFWASFVSIILWNKTSVYVFLYDHYIDMSLCKYFFSCHSVVEYDNRSASRHFPELETPNYVCLLNVL